MATPPPPTTLVRTSHSLTIKARPSGLVIGLINGWTPAISRTITPVYQIATFHINTRSGDPIEQVPGNVTGLTLTVQRYDIYTQRMEQAFGTTDLIMLSRQTEPFDVEETWQSPDNIIERITYQGCWFSTIGRSYRSDGDRIINVNATLNYTRRIKTQ